MTIDPQLRVLGIDPATRSVSFAVLEGPGRLIDWGLKTTNRANSIRALVIIRDLIKQFQPQVLAIEDCASRGSRRCLRVRTLLDDAASRLPASLTVRRIAPRGLPLTDLDSEPKNKHERACALAGRFPELQPRLPRPRKPWFSEDERGDVFDALAFALACFPQEMQTVANPACIA
jgi:hypothetical protein